MSANDEKVFKREQQAVEEEEEEEEVEGGPIADMSTLALTAAAPPASKSHVTRHTSHVTRHTSHACSVTAVPPSINVPDKSVTKSL